MPTIARTCALLGILLLCPLALLSSVSDGQAREKVYVLSYSPGTLFHSLVRDRVKDLYEQAGIPVEFVALPHKRSVYDANSGLVDGEVGRVPSVEGRAPNLRRINVKLMDIVGAAYVKGETDLIYSEKLLDAREVGMVMGVEWALRLVGNRHVTKVSDYQALFDMMRLDRIDLALATTASANSVLKQDPAGNASIHRLDPPIFTSPIYHYVHKKNAHLIPLLEKTLERLHREHFWGDE